MGAAIYWPKWELLNKADLLRLDASCKESVGILYVIQVRNTLSELVLRYLRPQFNI